MATILVVEDSASNAQLIKIALDSVGFDVVCASNGQEGLAFVNELNPALIIVDLRLPGSLYDGWTIIRMIRERGYTQVPIFVTAVEVSHEDRQKAFDAGCDEYFSKPFSISELRSHIINSIGKP